MHLPALRERSSDIPALVGFFLRRICDAEGLELRRMTPAAMEALVRFPWPGNVRQLEHAIEMAVVLSGNRTLLETADFPAVAQQPVAVDPSLATVIVPDSGLDFEDTINRFERTILQQALLRSNGNKARAAQLLRMKRTTLLARMKSLDFRSADLPELGQACA